MLGQDLQPYTVEFETEFWGELELAPITLLRQAVMEAPMDQTPPPAGHHEVKRRMDISNLLNEKDEDPPRRQSQPLNRVDNAVFGDISNQLPQERVMRKPAGFPDCILCPKKFAFHYQLEEHLISTHGHPPRECPHCKFACAKLVDIKRHVKVLHDIPSNRYHCYACEFSALLEEDTKAHVRTKHSRCPYCHCPYMRLSAHERVCRKHPKYMLMLSQMNIETYP